MRETHIVVVASNALNRSGIEALISRAAEAIKVVASFGDLPSADRFMKENRVDVLIVDDSLPPSLDIGRAVSQLIDQHPGLGVLMIASRPTASLINRVIECGARGFLHKDDSLDVILVEAIQVISNGGQHLSRRATDLTRVQRVLPKHLKDRDIDVLQMTADGYEASEISAQIGVSKKTVYRVLETLRSIYGAQNNAHLIDIAHHLNLLDCEEKPDQS